MKARIFNLFLLVSLALTTMWGRSEAGAPSPAIAARPVSFNCASVSQIPSAECQALATLYSTTNGSNWSNADGWLAASTPCTDWHGVTCSEGYVTELRLGGNNLSGAIPQDLHHLSHLAVLDLSYNKLTGWIPSVLGDLTNLRSLRLGYNSGLTWLIPWELGSLANLQELSLTGCNLFGPIPPTFEHLTELRSLDVSFNYLSGSVNVVGELPYLEVLALRNNQQLRGPLPSMLKDRPITALFFESTALCEPSDAGFQSWLAGLGASGNLGRTGSVCGAMAAAVSVTRNANDLVSSWTHETPNTAYDVHRSSEPYFTPSVATKRATLPPAPTGVYTDTGALAVPGDAFYIVQSKYNDLSADSNETAAFTYELTR